MPPWIKRMKKTSSQGMKPRSSPFQRMGLFSPAMALFSVLILACASVSHAAAITLKDEVGREVTFPYPPRRIVSLAPNVTETLFSLGLDEEVVGVSLHCNYPEKVRQRVKVGSYIQIDYERVIWLKPDLVIATGAGNTREMVERLERLGFPTFTIFPKKFDDVLRSIRLLGQVVAREKEAVSMGEEMKRRREKVVRQVRSLTKPRVFLQIGETPIVTVGKGSFADDLIRLAGGENISGKDREMYPRLGLEEILKRSPEVILVSSMNPGGDYERVLREWQRWKTIPAVKHGRIHLIDSDLIDRPAPRIIHGLEKMARLLHPEKFEKTMAD